MVLLKWSIQMVKLSCTRYEQLVSSSFSGSAFSFRSFGHYLQKKLCTLESPSLFRFTPHNCAVVQTATRIIAERISHPGFLLQNQLHQNIMRSQLFHSPVFDFSSFSVYGRSCPSVTFRMPSFPCRSVFMESKESKSQLRKLRWIAGHTIPGYKSSGNSFKKSIMKIYRSPPQVEMAHSGLTSSSYFSSKATAHGCTKAQASAPQSTSSIYKAKSPSNDDIPPLFPKVPYLGFLKTKWDVMILLAFGLGLLQWSLSNVLYVRSIAVVTSTLNILFFLYGNKERKVLGVYFNILFITINFFHIGRILYQARPIKGLDPLELSVYETVFRPHDVTMRQFKILLDHAVKKKGCKSDRLLEPECDPEQAKLRRKWMEAQDISVQTIPPVVLVLDGRIDIFGKTKSKKKQRKKKCPSDSIDSPCSKCERDVEFERRLISTVFPGEFFGEVAFFLDSLESWETFRPNAVFAEDTHYLEWDSRMLKEIMEEYPSLGKALHSIWNTSLANEVTDILASRSITVVQPGA